MKTPQDVIKDFFQSILSVISKNSSKSYGLIILKDIKKKFTNDFPILRNIKITDITIKVDKSIKLSDTKEIVELFNKIIDSLGPDLLKLFIRQQLDREDISYLERIGVKF